MANIPQGAGSPPTSLDTTYLGTSSVYPIQAGTALGGISVPIVSQSLPNPSGTPKTTTTLIFPTALSSQPPSAVNVGSQNNTGAKTSSYPFMMFSFINYRDPWSVLESPVSSSNIGSSQSTNGQSETFAYVFLPLPQTLESMVAPQWVMPNSKIISAGFDAIRGQLGWGNLGEDLVALLIPTLPQTGVGVGRFGLPENMKYNAANPKKAAFFSGIDPREFSFSWILTPQSKQEADTIYQIVKAFTQNSLPSLTADAGNSAFLLFPCEYKIYFSGVIGFPIFNQSLVCTSVATSFTPTNGIELGADGYAVSTQLTLTFRETTIRTYQDPGI